VIGCPACGLENADDATACARCHLAVELFGAVREATADEADRDPRFTQTIGEILSQLGDDPPPASEPETGRAALLYSHRFPAPPAPRGDLPASRPPGPVTGLPALPPAGDVPLLLRQVNDYLQLARRQGLELAPFTDRARAAVASQDRSTLEALSRDLFVHLAAALTDVYETAVGRRNDLAGLVPTGSVDLELEGCRASLALGDLAGAQRRLRHVEELVADLEDRWATVEILVTEADLIAETIRLLGGDPQPALGPLAEGRRRAREGDRAGAEPVLARATLALWTILAPMFQQELTRLRPAIVARRQRGDDMRPAIESLRALGRDLRHRNYASAVLAFRRLREATGGGGALDGGAPVAAAAPPDVGT